MLPCDAKMFNAILHTSTFKICLLIFSYVVSGEADGRVCFWDWKTKRIWSKFKAHDGVCICVKWLPHETSKVLTCGWDGAVKLWD